MHAIATIAAALVLPGFAPAATSGGGTLLTGVFPGTLRPGYVYLPPGFVATRTYPVVYLLHGLPGSPSEYVDGVGLSAFADGAIASGALQPFVAVMPAAGADARYDGEWAGPWEHALVDDVVPWVDAHLPVEQTAAGRVLAGLSAGGFGAVDIALRNPGLFGTVESWSGYFTPLHDGPFKRASRSTLAANDPMELVEADGAELRREDVRFFLSTGPYHSHWIDPAQTLAFAVELRLAGVPVAYRVYSSTKGEWREQLDDGLSWAFGS